MINHRYLEQFGIHYLRVQNPFRLDEFRAFLSAEAPANSPGATAPGPLLIDLRGVDLDGITEAEIRRHAMFKSTVGRDKTDLPCAYLVDTFEHEARVRMALVFTALSQVVTEERSFVSTRVADIAAWLAAFAPRGAEGVAAHLVALTRQEAQPTAPK